MGVAGTGCTCEDEGGTREVEGIGRGVVLVGCDRRSDNGMVASGEICGSRKLPEINTIRLTVVTPPFPTLETSSSLACL